MLGGTHNKRLLGQHRAGAYHAVDGRQDKLLRDGLSQGGGLCGGVDEEHSEAGMQLTAIDNDDLDCTVVLFFSSIFFKCLWYTFSTPFNRVVLNKNCAGFQFNETAKF
jgi:hypothetical protein